MPATAAFTTAQHLTEADPVPDNRTQRDDKSQVTAATYVDCQYIVHAAQYSTNCEVAAIQQYLN